jgi:hypothetical protein
LANKQVLHILRSLIGPFEVLNLGEYSNNEGKTKQSQLMKKRPTDCLDGSITNTNHKAAKRAQRKAKKKTLRFLCVSAPLRAFLIYFFGCPARRGPRWGTVGRFFIRW